MSGETGVELEAETDGRLKVDEGGESHGGKNYILTPIVSSSPPCQEEVEEVMEEEPSRAEKKEKEEEVVGMDTADLDSLQGEELTLR